MGFFDKVEKEDLDKLRSELQKKIESIESELGARANISEETARVAAQNAVEIESKIRQSGIAVDGMLADLASYKEAALSELQAVQSEKENAFNNNAELYKNIAETKTSYAAILESKKTIDTAAADVDAKMQAVNKHLEQSKTLQDDVSKAQNLLMECNNVSETISGLLGHSVKRKAEIDDLHKQIYGHDVSDEAGKSEHIDGTKDQLARAYSSIVERTTNLDSEIKKLVTDITTHHDELFEKERNSFKNLIVEAEARVTSVNEQLTSLLPGAMAAGLSAAYDKKKEDETESLRTFDLNFQRAIYGMMIVSLIPACVDCYLLFWKGHELSQIIKETPNLIAAILPLYFPVLWLAYSANKKANLSKRLIEEYTHKSVLGKTFSGLSNQIETLSHESTVKDELRTRLLFNILQVSAENPGKLITNYQKSDHPLMEALENSAKLAESVNSLSKIPGLSAIAKKLSSKSDDILRNQTRKVEEGLETQEALQSNESSMP